MSTFKIKFEIIPRYLSGPSKRRPCITLDPCLFMVAHDTGNPGSTAAGNVSYFENSRDEAEASAHLFVDDKEIIECIPFLTSVPEKAWHVRYNTGIDNEQFGADANDAAGGVELCYGGTIHLSEAYTRYLWVLAYSCYQHGLNPKTDLSGHHLLDPTRKTDPMNAFNLLGKTFEEFVQDVVDEYNDCLRAEEDEDNMPMKLEDWQWDMLYQVLGTAYNSDQLGWNWMQKIVDKTMTATELAFVNTVLDGRVDRGIEV
ncbi:peptidoglycan recognition protein family protein [Paenibacillus agricola]|uniref:N-acetylmuramoyl-L-alanine amidase n=1 Tax=Paenibacillus agricola TaxID=2716264 RepID=A0ABX0J8V4_9BACL|nr:peptidoglycan recognition family protein [Paenibacillus agricola]NHN31287.1 N-acetylmuramoyl-L-alanine amidase [Paenibacillus agricola]